MYNGLIQDSIPELSMILLITITDIRTSFGVEIVEIKCVTTFPFHGYFLGKNQTRGSIPDCPKIERGGQ
jgi:hypothetical protein